MLRSIWRAREPFLRSLQGFNITIPHKMAIIPMVDELDESAKRYNSVNCVANQNGKLVGYNTDCDGFTMSVKDYPMDGKVLLIGCGGVGRMIATEALRHGADLTIGIIPQDKELVEEFIREAKADHAGCQGTVCGDRRHPRQVRCHHQRIAGGNVPQGGRLPGIGRADRRRRLFLRRDLQSHQDPVPAQGAGKKGKVAKGGAAMLVLQAVRAHEIWNDDSYSDAQIESIICDMEELIDEQNAKK